MSDWGTDAVTVRFGSRTAVAEVDVAVRPGLVTTVVGGDGAGKSTLLKVCIGLITPDDGTVRHPLRDRIGAMVEVTGVYDDLTVDEHVRFVADAYGLDLADGRTRVDDLLGRAGLRDARHRLGRALSGGMRRKLAAVLALLHEPDLLVLDEPTTGVDPVSRAELWRLVGHAAVAGAAVLVSTTYLDEAERAAAVLVLDRGRTLVQGDPAEIADASGHARLEDAVIAHQRRAEDER